MPKFTPIRAVTSAAMLAISLSAIASCAPKASAENCEAWTGHVDRMIAIGLPAGATGDAVRAETKTEIAKQCAARVAGKAYDEKELDCFMKAPGTFDLDACNFKTPGMQELAKITHAADEGAVEKLKAADRRAAVQVVLDFAAKALARTDPEAFVDLIPAATRLKLVVAADPGNAEAAKLLAQVEKALPQPRAAATVAATGSASTETEPADSGVPFNGDVSIGAALGNAPADAADVLKRNRWRLRGCYSKAWQSDPKAKGTVTLSIKVSESGAVEKVFAAKSEVEPASLGVCAVGALGSEAIRFGGAGMFTVPVTFAPKGP